MNQKNLDYLKDQLKYTGFGETFEAELKANMLKGEKDFKIVHTGIMNNGVPNKDSLTVELNFKKSEQNDMYFLIPTMLTCKRRKTNRDWNKPFTSTKRGALQ